MTVVPFEGKREDVRDKATFLPSAVAVAAIAKSEQGFEEMLF